MGITVPCSGPNSCQELANLTYEAFDLADKYRSPNRDSWRWDARPDDGAVKLPPEDSDQEVAHKDLDPDRGQRRPSRFLRSLS